MLVEKQFKELDEPFVTEGGAVLRKPVVAYEEYGNPDGPVILLCHGGLSDQHAAGRYAESDPAPGWWDPLVGPGRVIDTDRFRILAANSLGSMAGTTSPRTVNPDTGCRYGPLFPKITLIDTARFHRAFLEAMAVDRLHLMAGPSMGSLQSLQMAALCPDFVGGVVSVATAGRMTPSGMAMHHFMSNAIKMDPQFQGGWYDVDRPLLALKYIHQVMRIYYTHEDIIKQATWDAVPEGPDSQDRRAQAVNQFLSATPDVDVLNRDPNCYVTLLDAINTYDLGRDCESFEAGVRRITCPVLLMNIDTDCEFQPRWAREVFDVLEAARPGQATLEVLRSPWGHLGCIKEFDQMAEHMGAFLKRLS